MTRGLILSALVFMLVVQLTWSQIPQTMSYQGMLTDAGGSIVDDGNYDLMFVLYESETGGSIVWMETHFGVPVSNGVFSIVLGSVTPLSSVEFDQQYWLGITVDADPEMTPLIKLTASPYSLNSRSVADGAVTEGKIAADAVSSGKIAGNAVTTYHILNGTIIAEDIGFSYAGSTLPGGPATDLVSSGAVDSNDIADDAVIGDKIADGQVVRSINGKTDDVSLAEGTNVTITSSGNTLTISSSFDGWRLTGNAGTNPAANFLGTTDNQPLELRVNNLRILRLEPHSSSPNIIGGYNGNAVTSGVYGATISGGGSTGSPNEINSDLSTIGGGASNTTNGSYNTVGGGRGNVTSMSGSTVAGGTYCAAISTNASVGGGAYNMVSARYGTIGGGGPATGETAGNSVLDDYGTVGGGQHNQAGSLAGTSEDAANSTVGGGKENTAGGYSSTVAGGEYNDAIGDVAIVAGGSYNVAAGTCSAIMGGFSNYATGHYSTLVGGMDNEAQGRNSSIGGGKYNVAKGEYSTIGGGGGITSSVGNQVTDNSGTVGGGTDNQAGNGYTSTTDAPYATVGGGITNTASGEASTIGGGSTNTADSMGTTVGGGWNNAAMADFAVVAGGGSDTIGKGNRATQAHATVCGGFNNVASGEFATVSGGGNNTAGGYSATVAGGVWNEANGQFSFAAGRQAKSSHDGCFVWGDNSTGNVESSNVNQFIARASGGVWFYSKGDLTKGVRLDPNATGWTGFSTSDKSLKHNIREIDGRDILSRLTQIPISRWNYKSQDPRIEHVGPMSQDFYAAFGLGADDKHIDTIDADGVALAAIQGLYELVREKDARIADLEDRLKALEARMSVMQSSSAQREQ